MSKPTILQIALPVPLYRHFDYLAPAEFGNGKLEIGMRVKVPFGKREKIGILISVKSESTLPAKQLKEAIAILDQSPLLSLTMIELITWASHYYHYPLGEVFAAALPSSLRKGKEASPRKKAKRKTIIESETCQTNVSVPLLNQFQQTAIETVARYLKEFQAFLLNGVTGSGKTEVYLQIIDKVIHANKQALVLIPEIGLTPQTLARFQQRFQCKIALFHSGLTEREKLDHWLLAKTGEAKIIIGTRSAIFAPLLNPGIIIIDEEHDISFKQQDSFRYCARDLAIVRARLENIPIVLGSATPSLESIYNVKQQRYQLLTLPERAGSIPHPQFHLIDLRNQTLENGLSPHLLAIIQKHLNNQGQILLFLNRRGFAPAFICQHCGWMAECKRCDAKLTLHKTPPYLQCHHCGSTQTVITQCPDCQQNHLIPLGQGTQRLEETLTKHFPKTSIVRIDRDSTRHKGKLENMLEDIHTGEHRILIGTQMLAKGHHFPDVTLVAILDADSGLFSADFRASERVAQLITQVAGRAGRAEKPGEVYIQTYHPQHPLLLQLIQQDYDRFAEVALEERKKASLPPYQYLALIRAEALNKEYPLKFLTEVKQLAEKIRDDDVVALGPVPAIMQRRAGFSREQLLLQSSQRNHLHQLLKQLVPKITSLASARRVRWSLDIDPKEMI